MTYHDQSNPFGIQRQGVQQPQGGMQVATPQAQAPAQSGPGLMGSLGQVAGGKVANMAVDKGASYLGGLMTPAASAAVPMGTAAELATAAELGVGISSAAPAAAAAGAGKGGAALGAGAAGAGGAGAAGTAAGLTAATGGMAIPLLLGGALAYKMFK